MITPFFFKLSVAFGNFYPAWAVDWIQSCLDWNRPCLFYIQRMANMICAYELSKVLPSRC